MPAEENRNSRLWHKAVSLRMRKIEWYAALELGLCLSNVYRKIFMLKHSCDIFKREALNFFLFYSTTSSYPFNPERKYVQK